MKNFPFLIFAIAAVLSFAGCNQPGTGKNPHTPVGVLHPLDTGPQLDTFMIAHRKEYSLEYQNDARTGFDVNDSPEQSSLLLPGTPVSGLVGSAADPADIYRIEIPADKNMMVSFTTGRISLHLNLEIWDDEMRETWSQYDMENDANVTYDFPPGTTGTHYLIVSPSNGGGPYQLTFKEKDH